MAETREEKKKVEKLKLKDLKKRHWAVMAAVGVSLGIMLGNIGGDEPAPKAEAKPVEVKQDNEVTGMMNIDGSNIVVTVKALKDVDAQVRIQKLESFEANFGSGATVGEPPVLKLKAGEEKTLTIPVNPEGVYEGVIYTGENVDFRLGRIEY